MIPIYRNILLISEQDPDDVEALFRANGLSTFTLGFAQISSFLLGTVMGWLAWPPATMEMVGLIAQCINIFLTGVYFCTKYPTLMAKANQIRAIKQGFDENISMRLKHFNNAVQDAASKGKTDESQKEGTLGILRRECIQEIVQLTCGTEDSILNPLDEEDAQPVGKKLEKDLAVLKWEELIAVINYLSDQRVSLFVSSAK